ncbi:5'-3' exonuclease [Mycoplasmopsis agalactiae]|nr:5'-3' exonuclease [Mycoplasmopsis agalactiae]MCE6090826.1 5'-3' exonuclease [Mycoplasmopsis agalactiae]
MNSENKLMLLVDGNFLIFQSFYASYNKYNPNSVLVAKDGTTTNGVHVFFQTLFKLIKFYKPTHMFIAFDAKGKTKRHEEYDDYKAGREKAPEIIFEQFDLAKKILSAMNIKWFEKVGYEADDLIATIAKHNSQFNNYIYSKDKDLLQLVNENNSIIKIIKKVGNFTEYQLETINEFVDIYGINPNQIPDYKGLAGDSSDKLKGVAGIGPKKAISLLNEFGTLEAIYENIYKISGKTKEYLENDCESAHFCKRLAILNSDVEMDTNIEDYKIILNQDEAIAILREFGFDGVLDTYVNVLLPKYKLT